MRRASGPVKTASRLFHILLTHEAAPGEADTQQFSFWMTWADSVGVSDVENTGKGPGKGRRKKHPGRGRPTRERRLGASFLPRAGSSSLSSSSLGSLDPRLRGEKIDAVGRQMQPRSEARPASASAPRVSERAQSQTGAPRGDASKDHAVDEAIRHAIDPACDSSLGDSSPGDSSLYDTCKEGCTGKGLHRKNTASKKHCTGKRLHRPVVRTALGRKTPLEKAPLEGHLPDCIPEEMPRCWNVYNNHRSGKRQGNRR